LALLPPSFLSSSPATVRSARPGAVKETSAGLVRPAAQRGHGPARLDGPRPRATVADKVMKSGETAGHGNGRLDVPTARKRSAQARSWKPGRRRQPSGARERWKPGRGETPQAARCEARQRDRPCCLAGDAHAVVKMQRGSPAPSDELSRHRYGRAGAAGAAGLQGRQAKRGGDVSKALPLECKRQRAAPRRGAKASIRPSHQGAGRIPKPASKAMTSSADNAHRARTALKAQQAGRTR